MKLDSLEAIPYSLPFRDPYVTARGELRERELLLVRVRGEGLEGLGETAALSLRGGADVPTLERELNEICWPQLADGGFEPERVWSSLARCRSRGASAPALAALDIALHDLAGKAAGIPVWRLLGASKAAPVVCNATLPAANPAGLVAIAERWADAGFRTFKLKVGLAGDVAQVVTVRQALGPEARIRLDANGAWGNAEAAERLRALARSTIELVEEPVSGLAQMATLRAKTRIPLAADESVNNAREARRAHELGACSLATVKLAKVGGITAALEVAEAFPVYLSSALEGPVGIAAAAHTVQALPRRAITDGLAHGLATQRLFAETVGSGVDLDGDTLTVGEEPGLGVSIDEDALAARRLR
jgi:L-alanine-DL-glutamate epimerase-like enolase superfamily enzyme